MEARLRAASRTRSHEVLPTMKWVHLTAGLVVIALALLVVEYKCLSSSRAQRAYPQHEEAPEEEQEAEHAELIATVTAAMVAALTAAVVALLTAAVVASPM